MKSDFDKSETREKILKAALHVFSSKGYSGGSTSEIAEEAGVAEGTIYRYFPTKKDLLLNIVNPLIVGSLEELVSEKKAEGPEVVLEELLHDRLSLITSNMDLFKVLIYESQFHSDVKDKFAREVINPALKFLCEYFEEEVGKGRFRDLDPEISVRVLAGMLGVFIMWWNLFEREESSSRMQESVIETIKEIYLKGVQKS